MCNHTHRYAPTGIVRRDRILNIPPDHTAVPGAGTTKLGQTSLQILLARAGSDGAPWADRQTSMGWFGGILPYFFF